MVADESFEVEVPDHIFIGIVLTDSGNFNIQSRTCWVTPDDDKDNPIQYNILMDGCPNQDDADNINIIENGVSSQSRFSFAAFQFLGDSEDSKLFMHCGVHICDANSAGDCEADCSGRRRRSAETVAKENVITMEIKLDMSVGKQICAVNQDCVECIPTYNGNKCDCPDGHELLADHADYPNSCKNLETGELVLTPAQVKAAEIKKAKAAGRASFHERLQQRLMGIRGRG